MKINFAAQIEVARLSYTEKALVHDKRHNTDSIVTKFVIHVGFIRIQIEYVDDLCGANRSDNTLL